MDDSRNIEKKKIDKSKRRQRSRKIAIAFVLVLFAGLTFTASTYAWFSADKEVTIDMVDVHASTTTGITISSDAINWKATLSNEDLINAYQTYSTATNQMPSEEGVIKPTSTIGTLTDGRLNMFSGSIQANDAGNLVLGAKKTDEEMNSTGKGRFVAFDFFIKSTTAEPFYLTTDSFVKVKDGTKDTGSENAIRVAFVIEGNTSDISNSLGAQRLMNGEKVVIWEPNNNAHNESQIKGALTNYGMNISSNTVFGSYYGVHSAIPLSEGVPITSTNSNYFSLVTPNITSGTEGLSSYQLIDNFRTGITKVRVYLWLEGQDIDCEDNSSGGTITLNLSFSINSSK